MILARCACGLELACRNLAAGCDTGRHKVSQPMGLCVALELLDNMVQAPKVARNLYTDSLNPNPETPKPPSLNDPD